jgi:hypothetical protein
VCSYVVSRCASVCRDLGKEGMLMSQNHTCFMRMVRVVIVWLGGVLALSTCSWKLGACWLCVGQDAFSCSYLSGITTLCLLMPCQEVPGQAFLQTQSRDRPPSCTSTGKGGTRLRATTPQRVRARVRPEPASLYLCPLISFSLCFFCSALKMSF